LIKVLVIISIIFAGVFSFGMVAAAVPAGQMAESFENLSNDILKGLAMYGLLDEDESIAVSSVIDQASISFELDVITVDPDSIPNTKDEFFINAISQCIFSSDEEINTETCLICTLTDSEQNSLGHGRVDLPDGYVATQSIPIEISELEFDGANDITNVHGVKLEVCSSNEGCTPGYWRSHFETWEETGLSPEYKFSEVFGLLESEIIEINLQQYSVIDPTLGEAVNANGGGLGALIRHSVAALLNSQSTINYPLTSEQVVTSFYESYSSGDYEELKDTLTELNENGCPFANGGQNGPPVNNGQGKSQVNNGTGKP